MFVPPLPWRGRVISWCTSNFNWRMKIFDGFKRNYKQSRFKTFPIPVVSILHTWKVDINHTKSILIQSYAVFVYFCIIFMATWQVYNNESLRRNTHFLHVTKLYHTIQAHTVELMKIAILEKNELPKDIVRNFKISGFSTHQRFCNQKV